MCQSFSSQSLKTPSSTFMCLMGPQTLLCCGVLLIRQPSGLGYKTTPCQLSHWSGCPWPLQTEEAQPPPTQLLWFLPPLHRLGLAPPAALSKIPFHIQPFFSLLNFFFGPEIGSYLGSQNQSLETSLVRSFDYIWESSINHSAQTGPTQAPFSNPAMLDYTQ